MAGWRRTRLILAGALAGLVAGAGVVATRRASAGQPAAPRFDPGEVARIETEGWRAYYDRKFLRGFGLLMELARGQFGLGFFGALRASYYAVRGQIAFAGERGDPDKALVWMTHYYAASPHREEVSPIALAQAEIDYWIVHRRLVREDDKTGLIDAFCRLHALIFGGTPEAMRSSAEQRTLACNAVDRITGRTSTDVDEDWRVVRAHLTEAYRLAIGAANG